MNKVKELKLTKKPNDSDKFYISSVIFDGFTGGELTFYGHEDSPPPKSINLFYPDYDINEYIDFSQNFDEVGQEEAKTHQILYDANQVGKVSIKDGNYPPPYNYSRSKSLIGYDQKDLSDEFFVKEIKFILQSTDMYNMYIILQKGLGSDEVEFLDRIDKKEIHDTGNYGLVIGIEDGLASDVTIKITGSNLNLSQEIGLVIVRFADDEYDMNFSNPHLFKKGVIELH